MRLREGFSGQRSIVMPKMFVDMMQTDPIASVLYITDIGYYPCAGNHFRERKCPIDEYVFIYCIGGKGWFSVDGTRHEVCENTYFILPAGKPHSYGADMDAPWTIYWFHFSGTLARHYAGDYAVPHQINPGMESRIKDRIELFEEIYTTLDSGLHIDGIRYAMSLIHHYLGTLRYLSEYRRANKRNSENDIIAHTVHFMNENIERSLTLAEISVYSGYSQSHLSSVFKAKTELSPLAYFNLLKVRHACRLLDETSMKLNSICHKVGISDPYYFSRMFSKIMGMSPTAYRHRLGI